MIRPCFRDPRDRWPVSGDALKAPILTPEEGRADVKGATEEREACVKILAALTMAHPDICVSCSERAISAIRARGDGEAKVPGQCCAKMRESQGASIGLPSGILFCPWCGARQTPGDLSLAPGRPVYP